MKFDVLVQVESYVNVEVEADSVDDAKDIAMSDLTLRLVGERNDVFADETYVKNVISVSELN